MKTYLHSKFALESAFVDKEKEVFWSRWEECISSGGPTSSERAPQQREWLGDKHQVIDSWRNAAAEECGWRSPQGHLERERSCRGPWKGGKISILVKREINVEYLFCHFLLECPQHLQSTASSRNACTTLSSYTTPFPLFQMHFPLFFCGNFRSFPWRRSLVL